MKIYLIFEDYYQNNININETPEFNFGANVKKEAF